MLLRRIVRRNRPDREPSLRVVGGFVLAILIVALIIRLVTWLSVSDRTLLTQAPGLVTHESIDTLEITPPNDSLESALYEIGVYTQTSDTFPIGTTSLVYVRNGWRFVEIDYLPSRSIEEQRAIYRPFHQEDVLIDGHTATFVELDSRPRCIDYEDGLPNKCEISKQLLFHEGEYLVLISADGNHATDGELLLLAQDILKNSTYHDQTPQQN